MKTTRLLLLLAGLLTGLTSFAATYYVDASAGNDNNNGTSTGSAWKTLAKVNTRIWAAGDKIYFKRGQTFRGQLRPKNGGSSTNLVTFGAYGSGSLPILLGSTSCNNSNGWTQISAGSSIWQHQLPTNPNPTDNPDYYDIGSLYFNNNNTLGVKYETKDNNRLTTQGDFFSDKTTGKLYLYSPGGNPGTYYSVIEAALNQDIVNINGIAGVKNIIVQDLNLKYGGASGIFAQRTSGIRVFRCEFNWLGGGYLFLPLPEGAQRYGNGITFWWDVSNCEVNRCKFFNIFDTGVTNQYFGGAPAQNQVNIYYYNNLFYNCGLASLEIANNSGGTEDNIRFINNTSLYAGYGWGQPNGIQRHPAANPAAFPKLGGAIIGATVVLYMAFSSTNSVQIRNNIFYGSWDMFVFRLVDLWGSGPWSQTTFSNNSYFSAGGNKNAPNPSNLCVAFNTSTNQVDLGQTYTWNEFYYQGPPTYKGWQTQKDLNAIQLYDGNAVFNDVYSGDYRLKSTSPCVNTGTNSVLSYPGLDKDIRGNITRPQNGTADMGAYEYSTGSGRLATIEQSPENDILFYPNPISDGKLNLSITDPEAQVSLTDMLGHTALVKKGIAGSIDVSTLDMGAYILKVVTQGVTHRKKVLIVR